MLRKAIIGHVYQKDNLLSALSVVENVALILRIASGLNLGAAIKQAQMQLETLGLAKVACQKPAQLSSGESKRISIIRALIKSPVLLLLDEPTANLDAANAELVAKTIAEFHGSRKGITIAVTHDPAIKQMADAHYRLEEGQVVDLE